MNADKELTRILTILDQSNLCMMDRFLLGVAFCELENRYKTDREGFIKEYGTRLDNWVTAD